MLTITLRAPLTPALEAALADAIRSGAATIDRRPSVPPAAPDDMMAALRRLWAAPCRTLPGGRYAYSGPALAAALESGRRAVLRAWKNQGWLVCEKDRYSVVNRHDGRLVREYVLRREAFTAAGCLPPE